MHSRWIVLALAVCLSAGCATPARVPATSAFDPSAAPLVIYADPSPGGTQGLRARLGGISAVREDGGIVPLRLLDPEVEREGPRHERLIAAGSIPPGRYTGFEVTATAASLTGPDGPSDLRVPETPTRVELPFTITERRGLVVDFALDLKAALADGFLFVPAFRAAIPARPPTGLIGLATLTDDGIVLAFDRRSGRVVGITAVGARPVGLAIDSARQRAYVAVSGDDALVAIDLEQGTIVDRRPLRGGDHPVDLALTPDGTTLVVANEGSSSVAFVSTQGLAEIGRAVVGESPVAVLLDRQGRRAFVPCRLANQVVLLDVASRRTAGAIPTDPGPFRVQLNRAQDRLYVAQEGSPYVLVGDLATLAAIQRPFVGPGQSALRVDAATDRIYIARRGTGAIEVFDPFSLLAIERLPVPGDVAYLTIDRELANLVAVLPRAGEIVRVSPVSRSIEGVVTTGAGVRFVALSGER